MNEPYLFSGDIFSVNSTFIDPYGIKLTANTFDISGSKPKCCFLKKKQRNSDNVTQNVIARQKS